MKPHKNLDAWKLSFQFVKDTYLATASFPPEEKFGLVSQIRRAAVSIPTNIAEGAARKSRKEFIQFLYVSEGSLSEVDTLLNLALELNFIDSSRVTKLLTDLESISKRIVGLIRNSNLILLIANYLQLTVHCLPLTNFL